jgi:hypothetical protein
VSTQPWREPPPSWQFTHRTKSSGRWCIRFLTVNKDVCKRKRTDQGTVGGISRQQCPTRALSPVNFVRATQFKLRYAQEAQYSIKSYSILDVVAHRMHKSNIFRTIASEVSPLWVHTVRCALCELCNNSPFLAW